MSEEVTLTIREQKRLQVLNELEAGRISNAQASELMGVTRRQVYRLRARYRLEGAAGLVHGNRGRPSPRHAAPDRRQ